MLRKLQSRSVTLSAETSIYIDEELTLPPGDYQAQEQRHVARSHLTTSPSQTNPVYLIELTGEQLMELGVKGADDFASIEHDVTKLVRLGKIKLKSDSIG